MSNEVNVKTEHERIWEIDFTRGYAIVLVVIFHFPVFLDYFGGVDIDWNPVLWAIKMYGGTGFVALSGLSSIFSKKNNGFKLFLVAMCFTGASYALYYSGIEGPNVRILWGVLHMIAFCKMLDPLIRKTPTWLTIIVMVIIIYVGYYWLNNIRVPESLIVILGLRPIDYTCFDYFPIFPHLGWYLFGVNVGRIFYKEKKSIFNFKMQNSAIVKAVEVLGRNCIWIYLIHMPLYYIIAKLVQHYL